MSKFKIIEMTDVMAKCISDDGIIYVLYRDLPPGAKADDNLIEDYKGKLHICNIEISPAD